MLLVALAISTVGIFHRVYCYDVTMYATGVTTFTAFLLPTYANQTARLPNWKEKYFLSFSFYFLDYFAMPDSKREGVYGEKERSVVIVLLAEYREVKKAKPIYAKSLSYGLFSSLRFIQMIDHLQKLGRESAQI